MKVIGIGDNVVDDYAHIRTMFPGGNALNFSVYASMLGCESAYLGVFGSDVAADHVQQTLAEISVGTSHCHCADGPNGRAILTIEDGERVFISSNKGGSASPSRWTLFSTISTTCRHFQSCIRARTAIWIAILPECSR